MIDIVVFGVGGFGREVHQIIEDLNDKGDRFNFQGFLDGNPQKHGTYVHGFPVLGDLSWLSDAPDTQVAVGVGNTKAKRKIIEHIEKIGNTLATLVHPRAWVGNRVEIGPGCIVCAGAMVTTDIVLRKGVILNINCTVGHDTVLHNFVTVAPGATISGQVTIGEGCDIGTNSSIIQGISIGEWSILGAGAVVNKDVLANVTAVGIPAKAIKERVPGWYKE